MILTGVKQTAKLAGESLAGQYRQIFDDATLVIKDGESLEIALMPWEYRVYVNADR